MRIALARAPALRAKAQRLNRSAQDRVDQRAGETRREHRRKGAQIEGVGDSRDRKRPAQFGKSPREGDAPRKAGGYRPEGYDRTRPARGQGADLRSPRVGRCGRKGSREPGCVAPVDGEREQRAKGRHPSVGEYLARVARAAFSAGIERALTLRANARQENRRYEEREQQGGAPKAERTEGRGSDSERR